MNKFWVGLIWYLLLGGMIAGGMNGNYRDRCGHGVGDQYILITIAIWPAAIAFDLADAGDEALTCAESLA